MSSSLVLPVMGESGLDARLQESNRGCLEEQEGGLLGTSGQGGCQSGKESPFLFSGATCGRSTCDIDLSL